MPESAKTAESTDRLLVAGLAKIGLALRVQAWKGAEGEKLTPTQGEVLALLQARPAGQRLGDVAEALAVTPPTASDAVAALVRKGLVRKARAADDGRALALMLTAAGRRKAEAIAHWPDFLLAAADALAPEEKAVFHRALIKMIRTLQLDGRIPVSRMCVSCTFFRPNVHAAPLPHHCAYVDAPFGDAALRIDCEDHQPSGDPQALWRAFAPAIQEG